MIKQILSPVVAALSFSLGIFFTSALSIETYTLTTEVNFDSPCFSAAYSSSRNKRVIFWSCTSGPTLDEASWDEIIASRYQVVKKNGRRYIGIFRFVKSLGYYAIRVNGKRETSVCSDSLPDVLDLEAQLAREQLLVDP